MIGVVVLMLGNFVLAMFDVAAVTASACAAAA